MFLKAHGELIWDCQAIIIVKDMSILPRSLILAFCVQNTVGTVPCLQHAKCHQGTLVNGKKEKENLTEVK
jgi:hypothetical protein